ncbi:MAG: gamma-glutamyltransferase [Cyanobacteria bacterium P01_H01_bin.121]
MTHGAIAAGHPQTAAAGIEILKQGGNAFDAAIAAFLAAFVVESMLTSPAGGGFLLARQATGQATLFDFFSQTPRQQRLSAELDFYPIDVNFGDALQRFQIGMGSIAVPGNLAGVFHVHRRLGSLPLEQLVEPALDYAESGTEFDSFQEYCLQILGPIVTSQPAGAAIYRPQGQLLRAGDRLVNPDLGASLRAFSRQGAQLLYGGELGQQLVQDCQQHGGHLSLDDLQQYQVIERSPLRYHYRGVELLTNPAPSSGGCLIAFALGLLARGQLLQNFGQAETHLQSLVQAMRSTNQARQAHFDPALYDPEIDTRFLATDLIDQYVPSQSSTAIANELVTPSTHANAKLAGGSKWGSTTHISVLDEHGNIASITSSNGEGSGYVIPNTGIMLNNMLGEADLNPNGFHNWICDRRLSSMMAPSLLIRDQQPFAVLGSGGSNRIRTAVLQVILNLVDLGLPVATAVHAPRLHWEASLLNWEPGFDGGEIETCLADAEAQLAWSGANMFFGGVHTLTCVDGVIAGAGDRRRNGVFLQC